MIRDLWRRLKNFGERTVKVKWVIAPLILLVLVVMLSLYTYQHTIEANYLQDDLTSYQDCARRVDTRDDLRGVLFAILDLYPDSNEDAQAIRLRINETYPKLDLVQTCGERP